MKSEYKWRIAYFVLLFCGEFLFFGIIKIDFLPVLVLQIIGFTLILCGVICYIESRIIEERQR